MAELRNSVVINRPVEDVFSYMTDAENLPHWMSEILAAEQTSKGPVGVGTEISAVANALGRRIENTQEVFKYKPNTRFAIKSASGPAKSEDEFIFESVSGGTKVTRVTKADIAGPIEMLEPIWPNIARLNSFLFLPVFSGPLTVALIGIFPDGHFRPRWARWLIPASLLTLVDGNLMERGWLASSLAPLGWGLTALLIVATVAFICILLYVPVYRYRFISTPEQRQQTKWVIYGFLLWFFLLVLSSIPWMAAMSLPPGSSIPGWLLVAQFFWLISTSIFPVTLTIAVMRYRLFEIDLLINRTLVYGALTAGIVGTYALVVGGIGVLFQTQSNPLIAFLATGLVAVLFQPLRERLQSAVNRLLYGERDDPATVFARLGDLLIASASPQETLPGLVSTIAQTLKLPYAAIELGKQGDREVVAAYGKPSGVIEHFALVYQLEEVGNLVVSP